MLRIRTLGLALVAVFALGAVVASAASAKKAEFKEPFPKKFTSTHGGEVGFKFEASKYACHGSTTYEGEITGKQAGSMIIRFKGCRVLGSESCESPGAHFEEIVTYPLKMTLEYINEKTKEVGVGLKGTGGTSGNLLAEYNCPAGENPIPFTWNGGIIGSITPINTATDEFPLKFAENETTKKQAPEKFEGNPKETLEVSANHGKYEEGVLTTEGDILTEGLTEIKA